MAPNLESVVVGRDCRLGRAKDDPKLPSPKPRPVLSVYEYILNVLYVLCSSKDYLEHHQKFTLFTSEGRFDRAQNNFDYRMRDLVLQRRAHCQGAGHGQ